MKIFGETFYVGGKFFRLWVGLRGQITDNHIRMKVFKKHFFLSSNGVRYFNGLSSTVLFFTGLLIGVGLSSCKESVTFDQSALLSSETENRVAPEAPTHLNIDIVSNTSLRLSWTSGGGTTSSFRVAYQMGFMAPANCNSGTVENVTVNTKLFTGLMSDKVYSFRVCALNSQGDLDSALGVTSNATPSSYCLGSMLTDSPFANSSSGGDGLGPGSAFKICTPTQLSALMSNSTYWDKFFDLGTNIDMTGVAVTPIGNTTTNFSGYFNGAGYMINGININAPSTNYVGFFGVLSATGVVVNLGLKNVNIVGGNIVGGIAATVFGVVSRSFVSGSVVGGSSMGGVVSQVMFGGTLNESYSEGTISGGQTLGGVAGDVFGTALDCYSRMEITQSGFAGIGQIGGIAAYLGGNIYRSYYVGSISASASDIVAGGVGAPGGGSGIYHSFANADVVGHDNVSLIAANNGTSPTITDTYFNTTKSCTSISACYDSSLGVQIDGSIGVAVSDSYFFDKTNAPLSDPSWDFSTVWQENASNYPTLLRVPENY